LSDHKFGGRKFVNKFTRENISEIGIDFGDVGRKGFEVIFLVI
jgi:hypothetical protein